MSYSDASDSSTDSSGATSAEAAGTDPFITLTITPDTGLGFQLESMEATEELGRPFLILLDVSASTPKNDLHTLLGSTATVKLTYPEKDPRYFSGIVSRVQYRGLSGGGYKYQVELRPWIWLLGSQQDCAIFSAKSPWTIMTTLFRDAGFTDFADKRQNAAGDTVVDYCVQYRETTLDFVTRLMEQYGIYYFVTHTDGTHTLNFADDPNSHTSAGAAIPYRYDQTGWRAVDDHVWDWSADAQIQPGAFTFRDYNFTTPKADLTSKSLIDGKHTHGSGEIYDYPGIYGTADDGQKVAQVRMQDFDTRRQIYGGTSNSRKLGAGTKFTLSDFADAAGNQEYLIIQSVCTVERAETRSFQDQDEIIDTFRCVMRAVPGTRPFRLPDTTPRPLIRGPQTARVAGESGQEVTTDLYGRIKVKFPWDRRTTEDENSSCWIRVSQTWAGKAWGSMVIPRIGQEVVVEFLEGNPDRPLVTGCVYNADQTVPYALPDNKTRTTTKSNSSLNGGGFNEWRFEDKKDSEEVFFQAQKDFNEVILGAHTETITGSTTTVVDKGNRSYTVNTGTDLLEVKGDRTVKLHANDSLTVDSNRTTTITGNNETKISGTNKITVTGAETNTLSDARTTKISSDDTTTVGGKSGLTVTSDHSIKTSASSTIDAATKILLKCGASSIEMTPSGITITCGGSTIEFTTTKIAVAALQVSAEADTTMQVSGLTTTVKGSLELELDGGLEAVLKGAMVMIN